MIGLRTPDDRIDQRCAYRAKIKKCNCGAVGWLQQSLELWRAEKDFGGTVGIVVHQFKARHEAARCELVCQCLRTDQIAPDFRAQVRRVNSAEDAMPISVISLASQNAVPGFLILRSILGAGAASRNRGHRR